MPTFLDYMQDMRKLEFNTNDSDEIDYEKVLNDNDNTVVHKRMLCFCDEESIKWVEDNCELLNYKNYMFFIYTCRIKGKTFYFIPVKGYYFDPDEDIEDDEIYHIEMYQTFPKEDFRTKAIKKIQRACHNWLYKPVCKDGSIGLVPRLEYTKCNIKLKNIKK